MTILDRIGAFHEEMAAWRRHLHQNPELGFEEHETAAFVADKLRSFGVDEVHSQTAEADIVRAQALLDSANAVFASQSALTAPFNGTEVKMERCE